MNTQVESSPISSIFTLQKKNDVHDLDRRLQLDSCDAHSLHFNAPAGWSDKEYNQYSWWYDIHSISTLSMFRGWPDSQWKFTWKTLCRGSVVKLPGLPGLGFTFSKSLELPSCSQVTGETTENANRGKWGFEGVPRCGKWWVACFLRVASAVSLVFSTAEEPNCHTLTTRQNIYRDMCVCVLSLSALVLDLCNWFLDSWTFNIIYLYP